MIISKLHYTKLQRQLIFLLPLFFCVEIASAQIADDDWLIVSGGGQTKEQMYPEIDNALEATTVEAERITGVRGKYAEAEGGAVIIRGVQELRGNYLFYDQIKDEITGQGDVSIKKSGVVINGDSFIYSPELETGEITDAEYFLTDSGGRGESERLIFDGPSRQSALNATYTSCDVSQEDVYLKTSLLNLYQDKEYGVARQATVWFKGAPILYTPFLSFPLTDKRKTGLLTPSYGQSVQNGFEISIPVYLNIAPNFDSTIALRAMSERGNLIASHSRYMGESFNGHLTYDVINDDKKFSRESGNETSRAYYNFAHQQTFGSYVSGYAKLQGISDDIYFKDLSSDSSKTSLVHLPRQIGLDVSADNWYANAKVVHYQTLDFRASPVKLDPQINFKFSPTLGYGFESESSSQFSIFNDQNKKTRRTIVYPGIRYVYENDFLTLSPKVGLHYTNYNLDTGTNEDRALPIYTMEASIAFERDLKWGGVGLLQTFVPKMFYVHVPFEDQSTLPVFDTGLNDFSFSQVFTENIFSGGDRINDADQLTVGLESKFLEWESGAERFQVTIAQRFHFDEEFVVINPGDTPRTGNRSDILLAAGGEINSSWRADSLLRYSGVLEEVVNRDHALAYNRGPGKSLNFVYRFARDKHEQFDLSGQWPIKGRWGAAGRWNFAKDSGKLLIGVLGLEYKVGCWAFRIVGKRLLTGVKNSNKEDVYATSFFVQLELTGITQIGSNAIGTLKENITGFSEN
jgi:LPS-assembly protein